MAENSQYNKYVTGFDFTTGEIEIDWEAINAITDQETGDAVSEYISKLEGLRDQWREAGDTLDDISDTVDDLYNRNKESYFNFESRLKEALIGQKQDEIDALTEINETITDTNSALLEKMQ